MYMYFQMSWYMARPLASSPSQARVYLSGRYRMMPESRLFGTIFVFCQNLPYMSFFIYTSIFFSLFIKGSYILHFALSNLTTPLHCIFYCPIIIYIIRGSSATSQKKEFYSEKSLILYHLCPFVLFISMSLFFSGSLYIYPVNHSCLVETY